MKEQLQKIDMVVGVEYKGYAWRNEYGEFFFRPAAEGSRAGRIIKLVDEENYVVKTTKDNILISIKIHKSEGGVAAYISEIGKIVDKLINVFMRYDI